MNKSREEMSMKTIKAPNGTLMPVIAVLSRTDGEHARTIAVVSAECVTGEAGEALYDVTHGMDRPFCLGNPFSKGRGVVQAELVLYSDDPTRPGTDAHTRRLVDEDARQGSAMDAAYERALREGGDRGGDHSV